MSVSLLCYSQVLCQFGCAVIEYDAERFNKIVLMFEVKDFHFLAIFTLGPHFPQVSLILTCKLI